VTARLSTEGVGKSFGTHRVLSDVDLEVRSGETLGLFGPNGSGKTTLTYILATLLQPSEGVVKFDGDDWRTRPRGIRRQIGFLSHRAQLYGELTARENLEFYAGIYGVPHRRARARELLELVSLAPFEGEEVKVFSRGMTQRLSVAKALLHDPPVLLFDEPFEGLDASGREIVCDIMERERERGKAVFLVTHDLELAHRLATELVLLVDGTIARRYDTSSVGLGEVDTEYRRYTEGEKDQIVGGGARYSWPEAFCF